jgi:hypothetical protein
MWDVFDLVNVAGHAVFLDAPELGFARVMSDEEGSINDARITLALMVVLRGDGDVVGFALDYYEWSLTCRLILRCAPNDIISAGASSAFLDLGFFGNLVNFVGVVGNNTDEEVLADGFFWCIIEPFLSYMTPYLPILTADGDSCCLGVGTYWCFGHVFLLIKSKDGGLL